MSAADFFNLAIAAALFGFAWLVWGALRPRPSDTAHATQVPAADDNQPGTDTAAADECALIYDLPAYSREHERFKKRVASDPHLMDTFHRIAEDHELAPDLADFADRLLKEIRGDQNNNEGGTS